MAKVDVDQVVPPFDRVSVKGDWTDPAWLQAGVQSLQSVLPTGGKYWYLEDFGIGAVVADGDKRRLVIDSQRGIHHPSQVAGLQVELRAGLVIALFQLSKP